MPRCFLAAKLKYPYVLWKEGKQDEEAAEKITKAKIENLHLINSNKDNNSIENRDTIFNSKDVFNNNNNEVNTECDSNDGDIDVENNSDDEDINVTDVKEERVDDDCDGGGDGCVVDGGYEDGSGGNGMV